MSELKVVYFAGKVSKGGGYRGKLLQEPRVMSLGHQIYEVDAGKLVYGGPFAISCDHGCFHQGKHGLWPDQSGDEWGCGPGFMVDDDGKERSYSFDHCGPGPEESVFRCLSQIDNSDAVHCYLETISCYGTLIELGYAAAKGKPTYIYYADQAQNWKKHFWFCMNLPSVKHCGPGEETSIHPDLLALQKSYKERYHEYLKSPEWNERRKAKIKEAGGRCQLCNAKRKLSVHHRTYDRVFNELLSDLIALCEDCHKKFHDIKEE